MFNYWQRSTLQQSWLVRLTNLTEQGTTKFNLDIHISVSQYIEHFLAKIEVKDN